MPEKRRTGRVDPPQPPQPTTAAEPPCPQCGGRVVVHYGARQCTVPGCGWTKGKAKP